ncbi:hypothetical protein HAX54_025538 [Datura stramonium]|uniref:Uncharacterized protein n=1 Tax=Datura stramonium TaxID=4076 RepID=A0ABS8S6A6_DATST|nr:hypothetical protein [Datura stramonium]
MTRRYANWWSTGRVNLTVQNKIILKCLKRDAIHAPSEVHHSQPQDRNKSSFVVKLKAIQSSSKPLTSKGAPTRTEKGTKHPSSILKSSITPSMVLGNTCKRKDPPTLFENDNGQISTEVLYKDETPIPFSVDEVVDGNGATSSTEDNETFFVGDPSSTMPLPELTEQLGSEGTSTDMFNGIFDEDAATSSSYLEISSPPCHPTSLRKNTLAHIDEQRAQLSKGQEKIIGFKSEIRAFEENRPLSEDEVKKFSKLKEAVAMSRQQILGVKPFP